MKSLQKRTLALLAALAASSTTATAQPALTEIEKYLVVAMGNQANVGDSFLTSCAEVGADRIVLSTPSSPTWDPLNGCLPNNVSIFGNPPNPRWNVTTDPDRVNGAATLFQGIDFSGNVALTGTGTFNPSNSLFFTTLGVRSARTSSPFSGNSNTSHYLQPPGTLTPVPNAISLSNGVTFNHSFATLLAQLTAWKTFINGRAADLTITSLTNPPNGLGNFANNPASNGNGGLRTTFNDTTGDGLIVVDVSLNGIDFLVNGTDWVIDSGGLTTNGPLIIFRVKNASNMKMENSSILMHESDLTATKKVGAIFFQASEGTSSGDTVFTVGNNTVLNGVALWDLNAVGPGNGNIQTNININNGQGCTQFISQKVNYQNSRWVRCSPASVAEARISIDPDDVNRVGEPHTFVVKVEANSGQGFATINADAVTVNLVNANGANASVQSNTCTNGTGDAADSEVTGQCFVTFTSNTTGLVTGSASTSVTVGGVVLAISTADANSPTGPAVKRFVDARISIDPDDVNRVGDPHTFTVLVEVDAGNGTGWAAVNVDTAVTVSLLGDADSVVNTCLNGTGDAGDSEATGRCSVTFTSDTPGVVTGSATATVSLTTPQGNINLPVSTADANSPTDAALKRFVDARISIDPDAVNGIFEQHTFTVLLEADSGSGWAPVDAAVVTVGLTGDADNVVDNCANGTGDAGDSEAAGQCSVTFTSDTVGTVTGSASAMVSLTTTQGSINVSVSTADANSPTGSAVKRFVDGSLAWEKEDDQGALLGGATFEVCRTHDRFGADVVPDECVTVLDNNSPDQDPADGEFLLEGLELGRYTIEETLAPLNYALDPHVETVEVGSGDPLTEDHYRVNVTYVWVNRLEICLVIIDEETIDNDISTIEQAAADHDVLPSWLVNDDCEQPGPVCPTGMGDGKVPTEIGNPWLLWNTDFSGDVVLLPGGQVDDEGWFALPEVISYVDDVVEFPFADLEGSEIADSDDWIAAFAAGTLPQDKLDKVRDVMPLRNQDLAALVGRTCVAVVYDSGVNMNYEPIYANLQGKRNGRFAFTVLAVEVPGSLQESQSNTSLYDLWLRVEGPTEHTNVYEATVRDHEPDSIEITRANYSGGQLVVWGTSDFAPGAIMTVSVDGTDDPKDAGVDPFLLEAPMTYNAVQGRYELVLATPVNLVGRRVTISTDEGGAYTDVIQANP